MKIEEPQIVEARPAAPIVPPEPLPDFEIQLIHAGLLIPSVKAVHSMAREIRMWRGVPNPDLI